jgi:hypothetical protein
MFSDCYGECSKGFKGIVRPDDSCGKGERKDDEYSTAQFIGMLDNVSYELAERVLAHRLANRQWHVGDRFAYILSDDECSRIEFGIVTEVKGDRIWGRLDEEPTRDVMFGRSSPDVVNASGFVGIDLSLAECDESFLEKEINLAEDNTEDEVEDN